MYEMNDNSFENYQQKINLNEFPIICRICFQKNDLKPFQQNLLELYTKLLSISEVFIFIFTIYCSEIIYFQSQIQFKKPNQICKNCLFQLENISKFINKCFRSEEILQKVYLHKRPESLCFVEETVELECKEGCSSKLDVIEQVISKSNQKTSGIGLKNHERLKSLHECIICKKVFHGKSAFSNHSKLHKGENDHKKFLCNFCGKSFIKNSHLERHIRIHTGFKPYKCQKCDKCFGQGNDLKRHLLTHSREKVFQCTQCTKAFHQKSCLDNHMLTHTNNRNFICWICEKKFVLKSYLEIHLRIHTGHKPFSCLKCDKQFNRKSGLNNHMLIHSGKKPFKCEICSKGFLQSNHLKEHIKTHSGEKPYICSYCGKAFAYNSTLKVHLRQHTGEKPFVCSHCNKRFYDSSNLRRHTKNHQKS